MREGQALGLLDLRLNPSSINCVTSAKHVLRCPSFLTCAMTQVALFHRLCEVNRQARAPHLEGVDAHSAEQEVLVGEASDKMQEQGSRKTARMGCGRCWRWWVRSN